VTDVGSVQFGGELSLVLEFAALRQGPVDVAEPLVLAGPSRCLASSKCSATQARSSRYSDATSMTVGAPRTPKGMERQQFG